MNELQPFICDLHVHIGRTLRNKAVKITAARDLTFPLIAKECVERKGIDVVGIIDCASPPVLQEISQLVMDGEMQELSGGGLRYRDQITVILGAELETTEVSGGLSHQLAYFAHLHQLKTFSASLMSHVTNLELSSQRCRLSAQGLFEIVDETGGILVPAHAFTPHKSVYGNCSARLHGLFDDRSLNAIPAIELGLSADTDLADHLVELAPFSFLTNSDAHSLPKIAREYNILQMATATYEEFLYALRREKGRCILSNYGLDPRLGKYHRSFCEECQQVQLSSPPVLVCERCGSPRVTKGVLDRIVEIQDREEPIHPDGRPPYHYQIPLQFVPKVGAVTLNKLINRFGSEMAVLHCASQEELLEVVGREVAENILLAREGRIAIQSGGGGEYGRALGTKEAAQLELLL